jgi:Uma2 family endonuclease
MPDTLVSVEEYRSNIYHPDVDYVDGHLEERNVGEKEHGKLQLRITLLLKRTRKVVAFIETRIQISRTRYRIPDVCAYEQEPDEPVFTQPPVLCVEVLSPEDRIHRVMNVVRDYLSMGVPVVWALDRREKKAYIADSSTGLRPVEGEIEALGGRVRIPLDDIFSEEDFF